MSISVPWSSETDCPIWIRVLAVENVSRRGAKVFESGQCKGLLNHLSEISEALDAGENTRTLAAKYNVTRWAIYKLIESTGI